MFETWESATDSNPLIAQNFAEKIKLPSEQISSLFTALLFQQIFFQQLGLWIQFLLISKWAKIRKNQVG